MIIDLRNNGGGEDGNALIGEHPQLRVQQPAAAPFLGKVFFLINGNSFSATAEFASVARSEKRGMFIGEETGGGSALQQHR